MAGNYKRSRIGLFGFTPEVTAGTQNLKFSATGSAAKTQILLTTSAVSGYDNANIAGITADFFNGLEVYWIDGNNAGTIQTITDTAFSSPTLTLTTSYKSAVAEAAATIPVSGEHFYVVGRLPASNVSFDVGIENLPREEFVRNTLDRPSSLRGLPVVSGSFDMEVCGREVGIDNTGGGVFSYDRFTQFYRGIGAINAPTQGDTIAAVTSTNQFTPSNPTRFALNQIVLINSEVTRIVSIDGANEWTVYPALSTAPSVSDVIVGAECFVPYDTGHQTCTFSYLMDDELYLFKGCVYNMAVNGDYGTPLASTISFTGTDYSVEITTTFNFNNSSKATVPFISGKSVVNVYASPATQIESYVGTFGFDYGSGIEIVRDSLNSQSALITTREATVGITARNTDSSAPWKSQTVGGEALGVLFFSMSYIGTTATNGVGVSGLVQPQDPSTISDRTGIQYFDNTFNFVDNATDVNNAHKPLFFRF